MFLELKNLSKKYKNIYAINNINLNVEKGEFVSLLGPSGSGKSTILHSIGGFIKADGDIFLDGLNISNLSPEDREVSTVFQSFGLFPHMNVLQNVSYGLKFKDYKSKKQIKACALDTIDKVGLSGYEKRFPAELSGGEKQRVALARSLVIKPKLLLMDEPLSSLDAKLREKMQYEIKKIVKDFDITTIFVTHDQKEAFVMSDKIFLLNKGKIEASGTAYEIYNKPSNFFTLDFIGQKNLYEDGYIRPENIEFSNPVEGCEFKIKQITFFGETLELLIENRHSTLRMLTLNRNRDFKVGESIYVKFKKEKISQ